MIAADRATAVRARIFLMPFVADAASAFETQSENILHGCHAVSYFLALKKTCTHDRQKRKRSRSFEPPEVLSASIPGARSRGKQDFRAKGENNAELGPN